MKTDFTQYPYTKDSNETNREVIMYYNNGVVSTISAKGKTLINFGENTYTSHGTFEGDRYQTTNEIGIELCSQMLSEINGDRR